MSVVGSSGERSDLFKDNPMRVGRGDGEGEDEDGGEGEEQTATQISFWSLQCFISSVASRRGTSRGCRRGFGLRARAPRLVVG